MSTGQFARQNESQIQIEVEGEEARANAENEKLQRYIEKHQGGSMMDTEQQIEDLCLDKARNEATIFMVQQTNVFGASMEELASLKAKKQIARARIQAIDSQLEELRNKLAKNYKEDITTKQEANS